MNRVFLKFNNKTTVESDEVIIAGVYCVNSRISILRMLVLAPSITDRWRCLFSNCNIA